MKRYVIVIDLGSSGMRSSLVDSERPWEVTALARAPYPGQAQRSVDDLARAFQPQALRRRLFGLLEGAASQAKNMDGAVVAISITAQRGGTAFLDSKGETVYVGPNTDLRAVFEGAAIDERIGHALYQSTGHLPSMFFTPAKLAWWRMHRPMTAKRIARVATLAGWAAHELTGELSDNVELLTDSGLIDVVSGQPKPALLEELSISATLFPPIVEAGSPCGQLAETLAAEHSLGTIPVCIAGPDAQCGLLGMGVVSPGEAGILAGWSAPFQIVTPSPTFDPRRRTWVTRHVMPERWIVEANAGDTGGIYEHMRGLLGQRLGASRFDALAERAGPAESPVIAVLGPHALDLGSPGTHLGGIVTPTPITYHGLSRGAIARATLENIAFALRECHDLAIEVANAGNGPLEVGLTGGMAASRVLPGLLANVLGRPVRLHHSNATASGAAILAATPKAQRYRAARDASKAGQILQPRGSESSDLNERYRQWALTRTKLASLADEL